MLEVEELIGEVSKLVDEVCKPERANLAVDNGTDATLSLRIHELYIAALAARRNQRVAKSTDGVYRVHQRPRHEGERTRLVGTFDSEQAVVEHLLSDGKEDGEE